MMIDFMEREVVYERFVKGDEKALELLYDQYFATLGVYAGRFLREENVCVDIVHESFIKAWEKKETVYLVSDDYQFFVYLREKCLSERVAASGHKE
ncbi:MAG: RNA polymerase sigma factor [Butyricimonas virosa]